MFIEVLTEFNVNEALDWPARSVQTPPLLVLTCHCIVGEGKPPELATENVAFSPEHLVWSMGWEVIVGDIQHEATVIVLEKEAVVAGELLSTTVNVTLYSPGPATAWEKS